jgi:hypothetical protein
VRGRIVAHLGDRPHATLAALAAAAGVPVERAAEAVRALVRDGLLEATPAAQGGAPSGRVRLAGR